MHYGEPVGHLNKRNIISAVLTVVIFFTQLILFSSTDIVLIRQGVVYLNDDWQSALSLLCAAMFCAEYVFIFLSVFSMRAHGLAAKCLCAFFIWLVVSRVLCGDPTLVESVEYVRVAALCTALFCFGLSLKSKERRCMLNVLVGAICIYYFVLAIMNLVVAVTRENLQLPLGIGIAIKEEAGFSFVTVVGRHRNTSSMWYVISLCLVMYLFSLTKSRLLHVVCAAASLVFYAVVSVSRSRLTMLALSTAVSMLVMLLVLDRLSGKATSVRIAAALITAVIIVPMSYKSYDVIGTAISNANELILIQKTDMGAASNSAEDGGTSNMPPNIKNGGLQTDIFEETRDASNIKNLGGRVRLWKSVYTTLYFERSRLLYGSLTNGYMYTVNMLSGYENPENGELNTHNYLLEALVLTGIPGFLLLLAFTVILAKRMIYMFFCATADIPVKLLTVPLAATLVKNMGEAMIARTDDITNYFFFLVAGVFLAYSYELLPEKKLHLRKT